MPEIFGYSVPFLLVLIGAALIIMEAFAPGAHFIVAGIALLVAGLVGLALGGILPSVVLPIVLAAIVLLAGGTALYIYRQFDFYGGKGTGQTSDSKSLRGRTGRVTKRVTANEGEIKLFEGGGFNPYYQARALDTPINEGEEVIVVDPGGGNVLTVESMHTLDDIDRELERERQIQDQDKPVDEELSEGYEQERHSI